MKEAKNFDDMKVDMDKRFDRMIAPINWLTDKLEDRDNKQRGFTLRMFTILYETLRQQNHIGLR